jgi:hypothetical protein
MNAVTKIEAAETEWRAVEGFPGYHVSIDGDVRSKGRWGKPKILRKFSMKGRPSYSYVNLYCDGKMSTRRVSVLVCVAFHGHRPSSNHEAAHNNGVHNDDRATNLRWATRIENAADRRAHGTQVCGAAVSLAKLTDEAVRAIRKAPAHYGVGVALARQYGVHPGTIVEIRQGRTWRHVS